MKNSNEWHNEGRRLQIAGQTEKAARAYQEALKLEKTRLDSINNLAVIRRQEGFVGEASKLLNKALKIASAQWVKCNDNKDKKIIAANWARLLNSSSIIALQKKRYKECLAFSHQQILVEPEGCGYVNLGVALDGLGNHRKAARSHLLSLRRHKLKWKKAEELIGRTLHNPTTSSQVHRELSNLAMSKLYDEPLSVEYWRLLQSRLGVSKQIWSMEKTPWEGLWKGETCQDLLVWDEQGYGDALQCLRWINACTHRTQQLTLMLRPALLKLIKRRLELSNNCRIVCLPTSGPPLTKHERHCPLMGLPVALADERREIPTPRAPNGQWLQSCYQPKGNKSIGFVWAAGSKGDEDAQRASDRRSMPAEALIKHALSWHENFNAELISLQLDAVGSEPAVTPAGGAIQQLMKGGDWESTAGVVEQLDLVVSVDTAMVHLAGNLGVPCLLLLNRVHDWRWGTEDEPQDWYPRQVIIRCKKDNDWETLLQEADSWVETLLNG